MAFAWICVSTTGRRSHESVDPRARAGGVAAGVVVRVPVRVEIGVAALVVGELFLFVCLLSLHYCCCCYLTLFTLSAGDLRLARAGGDAGGERREP